MNVGDRVRVVKCAVCEKAVGKIGKVASLGEGGVEVKFGRGRPQLGRPVYFAVGDVALVEGES